MLILGILLAIVIVLVYIYGGLKLAEDLDTPSAYSLFWVAYILFGLTLGTIIMLGNFWSVLVNKTGPPGARGIPGQQGDAGLSGECDAGHNTYYAMKQVKQAIVDTILELQQPPNAQTSNSAQKQITSEMIYDPTANRLTNIYLDNTIDRMITSKQFDILLDLPLADLQRLPAGKRKTFAKSLEDLSGYLAGTWRDWITGFYAADPEATIRMVSNPDTTPEDQPKLVDYLNQEIEKYDIWYWGTTRVFRPLKAEICRAGTITYTDPASGKKTTRANTRFPSKLRPQLEIREIEYSDKDTSKLKETWVISSMPDANKNFRNWRARKDGIYGNIPRPKAMIPKVIKEGNKTFYPIGQVFINSGPTANDTKKKTILVSGDVVIPDKLVLTWEDRKGTNILRSGGKGKADGYGVDGRFYQAQTSHSGYKCLGDYYDRDKRSPTDVERKYGYDTGKPAGKQFGKEGYTGLVCLPNKCLEEIPRAENPEFAYQFSRDWYKNDYWQTDNFTAKDAAGGYNIVRGTSASYKNLRNKKLGPQPGDGKFYRIKPECLTTEDIPVKEPEPEFTELGMGWFGHPYKTDRKYSVFAFLGIMPEGIIVHRQSGQRLYIRHYGGMEPNRFVILNWDGETDNFNHAVRAKSSSEVDIVELNLTDERQNWRLATRPNSVGDFQLASAMFPSKFLSFTTNVSNKTNFNRNKTNTDLEKLRPPGVSVDKTRMTFSLVSASTQPNPQTLFTNLPAYGTDTDILDEPSAKPIDRRKSMRQQQSEERARSNQDFSYINRGFGKDKADAIDRAAVPGNLVEFTK